LLKPHPRGLEVLIAAAGVKPHETILIGDRPERDGLAARHVGAWALIRSSRPVEGWQSVTSFDDAVFAPVLRR
jgi:FMN phosphatase YigB (HAD superfamily)